MGLFDRFKNKNKELEEPTQTSKLVKNSDSISKKERKRK